MERTYHAPENSSKEKKTFKDDLLEEEEKGSLRQIERVNV